MFELRALGTMCHAQGDFHRAEQHYRLALTLYETNFNDSHTDAAICLIGLVQLLKDSGRLEEAQQFDLQLESMNTRRRS